MSKPKVVILACQNTLVGKLFHEALQERIGFLINEFDLDPSESSRADIRNIQEEQDAVCIVIINEFYSQDGVQKQQSDSCVYDIWRSLFPATPIVWCEEDARMYPYMFAWSDFYRLSIEPEVDAQIHIEHAAKYGMPFSYLDILVKVILKVAARPQQKDKEKSELVVCQHVAEEIITEFIRMQLPDIDAQRVQNHMLVCSMCAAKIAKIAQNRLENDNK